MEETFTMSLKELERVKILSNVKEKKISQVLAAKKLRISDRQVRNLLRRFESEGDKGVISKKKGKKGNHCLPAALKCKALHLVREYYDDFGPTLANEYLKEKHDIYISKETLRKWMIDTHLFIPKNKKNKKIHLLRERRRDFGELIQIDGSHHDWFEGRRPSCVLMVLIDDSTSTITSLHFAEEESLEAYYHALSKHLTNYGIPLSLYGDRCSVLTPRKPKDNKDSTQFQKALKELNCQLILALSPEAKGRVERANQTLQKRLVRELRVRGISTIQEANEMLEEYRKKYNQLFSKTPSEQKDAHRSLEGICIEHVLCVRETRTLNKDFIVQYKNTFYQISTQAKKINLFKGGKIEIKELLNGNKIALFKNEIIDMKPLFEVESPILDSKEIQFWKPKEKYIPSKMHPYRHGFILDKIKEQVLRGVV